MNKIIWLVMVALAFIGFMLQAQAQSKQQLTIEEAIQIGLKNSRTLHSSEMRVQATAARSSEVNASRLPSLKAAGSYTRLSDVPSFEARIPAGSFGPGFPPQTVTFPLSQTILDNYSARLSLQQPLFTGFRLQSASRAAQYSAQATEQDYYKDRSDLVYNVRNAYWTLYKAHEFKKVIDENVNQMEAHLKDVQNFYNQGIVTKNEVLKVEVQLSNAKVMQLDAANNVQLASIALNNTIGQPLETEVQLVTELEQTQRQYGELSHLVGGALNRRAEIQGMRTRVKAGESNVTLAKSGWFPQVYLSGNYYYARPNQRIVPTVDQFKDTWDVSISVSFDVWNWGQTVHQTQQAQAQLAQAEDALAQMRDGITLEVTQSYLNLNKSREQAAVAEKAVAQAEENCRITNAKFKGGLALNSDLLDAEVALLQARWNYIQSVVDHELADARLLKAIAQDEGSLK